MERRLTTIVAADVVGYSRLMGDDEALTLSALKSHREDLIDPKAAQYGGRTVKLIGDGILLEFGSVVDAVCFAVEVQTAMRERNADVPENRQIVFRVGINVGDVIVEGDDIYGDGVNLAARLEALSEPGGICVRRNVRNQVRGKLDIDFEDLGEIKVKNIERPVRAFKVVLDDKAKALRTNVVRPNARPTRNRLSALVGAVGLFAVVAGGLVWWQLWTPREEPAQVERMALPLPSTPSIAVLPLDNMSDDSEQSYFADGMTEDLITDLSKIDGLFVISRNSSFTYKDKPVKVRKVAEDLGVRYVVEGSVRRAGDQVRINVQLIDALSGYHVWADRYDGKLADIFSLQDRVVGQIVSALAVSIKGASPSAAGETANSDAYDAFLEGWERYRRQTSKDTLVAIRHFETALDLDPNYGRAYAGLAASYWQIVDRWWSPELDLLWLETFELARTNLSKALAQPTALAYQVSADLLRFEGRTEDALRQIEKAIGLEPGKADSFVTKAQVLIDLGRFGEAEQSARLAMRMNPHFGPNYLRALGRAQFFRGQHEEAIKSFTRIVERQPEQKEAFMRIAAAYGQLGRTEEARKAIRHYNNIMAKTKYSSLTVQEAGLWWEDTLVFKDKSIPEPLFDGLRKAGVPEGAAPENEGFDFKSLVKPTYGERGRAYEVADIAKVGAADVKAMLQRGGVVVDVRDAGSYGRGHIPGAHNLDLNLELTEDRLGRLASKSDDVVFHCWGEKCSYSAFACAKARLWGYQNVYYFAGGFPGWKAAGYEIAK